MGKYLQSHTSVNWLLFMPIIVNDVFKREHNLTVELPSDLINKVAATHLGHDLSTYNGKAIKMDTIYEIVRYLLPKAKKSHVEKPPTTHYWSRNDPNYIKRRI